MELRLADLPKYLSNESEAWKLLERLRWNGEPVCPHCGTISANHYFVSARSGTRQTANGNTSYRRLWKCRERGCRKQFSVLVGTIFESSKVPVSKWLLAIWMMNSAKNGVSALEMHRQLGVSQQTAWFIGHRLREAMKREPLAGLLSGTVVADDTFVGGAPKNRHASRKGKYGKGARADLPPKTPVLALVEKDSSQVRTRVVTDVTTKTLRKAIARDVDMPATMLHTDGHGAYHQIGAEMAGHEYVDHSRGQYVGPTGASTNMAESFFAQFKRSLDGTYHSVSSKHLHRYASEFSFRWNTKGLTDTERVIAMIGNTRGRRLSYRPAP
jgi:transposase-like protein